MAKSVGLGTIELATHFDALKPDVVLTVADRFETIATAIAASYMNIPVAHTQGGEVTGSIDENVRHAITKLSHIHFPATARAREFLLRMGEREDTIFVTGCPSIDVLVENDLAQKPEHGPRDEKGTLLAVAEPGKGHVVVVTDCGWLTNDALSGKGIGRDAIKEHDNFEIFLRLLKWSASGEK